MSENPAGIERGVAVFKQGDFGQAVRLLEEFTRSYPGSYDAFVYLGAAYSRLGRHNHALGALRRACEINPNSPRVHYNLGQAYEAAGVPREAWFEYTRAVEIDPNYGLARGAMISLKRRLPELLQSGLEVAA